MYKIGTGEGETIPGKVYLEKRVFESEEVTWVYVKGKIYLRKQSDDVGKIAVINPETLEEEK